MARTAILSATRNESNAYEAMFAKIRDGLVTMFESPWCAYPLLLALQLKIIWKMWAVRDITSGDTSSYFESAWTWFSSGQFHIAWSPIYCAFYGSLLHLNPDPVWATVIHRMIIVLASGLLVLAVMRKLMPPAMAWLCAAWWVVLPIAFNTLYEVHLFAVLPCLVIWWLFLTSRGPARRALGLAVLGASVVLVRNELSVPFVGMALVLCVWEFRTLRRIETGRLAALRTTAVWYFIALSSAFLVCFAAYQRSVIKYPELSAHLKHKHTLNMAQVYAFGYQQRNPEWGHSPWTECEPLMEQTFGNRLPTLREMITTNPRAVWDHFSWNFGLTPSGLQILLFNSASGSENPDYAPSRLNRTTPLVLSFVVGTIWIVGFGIWLAGRRQWWKTLESPYSLGWIAMLVTISVMPLVIATQRPRPSYLFSLAVTVIAVTGALFWLVLNRCGFGERFRQMTPALASALVLFLPSYFIRQAESGASPPRTAAIALDRLKPFRSEITQAEGSLISSRGEIRRYFLPNRSVNADSLYDVLNKWQADEALPEAMAKLKVNYFYFDEEALHILNGTGRNKQEIGFAGNVAPAGWEIMAGDDATPRWRLFRRAPNATPAVPSSISSFPTDLAHPSLLTSGIYDDGWTGDQVSATLALPEGEQRLVVRGQILEQPTDPSYQTEIVIHSDDDEILRQTLRPGDFELDVPISQTAGNRKIELRFSKAQALPAPDTRVVGALLKHLAFEPKTLTR